MSAFDPGWLRHRIVIEQAAGTPDAAGGESVAWTELATLWARIEPIDIAERAVADHRAAVATHRITIRWRDDVTGGMRAVYRARLFRILAVADPDEARRFLVATAKEETT